ncbi:MAG: hypothetical protein ACP5O2_03765 [Bacteroidales bacterium]
MDNGYIFEWTLNLSPALLPQSWGYIVSIDSTWFEGPFILSQTPSGAVISPQNTGIYSYQIFISDEFGCVWDTSVNLEVRPLPTVELGPDQTICQGSYVELNAPAGMASYQWNTGQTTPTIVVNQGGTYVVTVTSPNSCQNSDSITITVYPLPSPLLIKHH